MKRDQNYLGMVHEDSLGTNSIHYLKKKTTNQINKQTKPQTFRAVDETRW